MKKETPEKFLTALFDRENPPALDRVKRLETLSLKEIRALETENPSRFRGSRGRVALGLIFLWNDHWEEAHRTAQADEGEADHDLLHAIAHRREQDFANSAYWFREAGQNAAFDRLSARAAKILSDSADPERARLREKLLPGGQWNAEGFLAAVKQGKPEVLLRDLQSEEIIAFFEILVS